MHPPSRSCFWPGTHAGHRAGKEQEKGRSRCQAHASLECRWECREGWHGNSWRRPEQTPAHGPASPGHSCAAFPAPERRQLTRNQPSNPKKTDSNPKENTGDRARPCWIPSLWSRILEKGDECPHRVGSIPQGMVWEQPQAGPCSGLEIPFAAGVGINPDGFLGYE